MTDIARRHVGPRMSLAVEHNGVVYLAGQVGDDLTADVPTQTEQILAKIDWRSAAPINRSCCGHS